MQVKLTAFKPFGIGLKDGRTQTENLGNGFTPMTL